MTGGILPGQGSEAKRRRKRTLALVAVALAGAGIVVAMVGQRTGSELLEDGLGPALTLGGAGLWLWERIRRGRPR